jgi:hypothetical protein
MSVDLMLPAGEKITPVLEGIGDDKIRVNSSSLARPSARNRGDREEGHGGAHGALGLLAERRAGLFSQKTPVLEGIGDDKIRVNSSSLARPSARNRGDREEGHGGAHGALGLLAER